MDPELLADELEACKKRGKLPKAVVPTDLYGSCADLDRIMGICNSYDMPVVTDSAESLGARYLTQRRKDANVKNRRQETGQTIKLLVGCLPKHSEKSG
ncbi:MAG: DegT/DnrJ/EryC1/StrS family aminotransferase, partial [Deltaproteobacteria bacterium]|nr:DegT/DnrJ/EryC1/StrS family aminotransferase [Deltaproteobacteria bacterium]